MQRRREREGGRERVAGHKSLCLTNSFPLEFGRRRSSEREADRRPETTHGHGDGRMQPPPAAAAVHSVQIEQRAGMDGCRADSPDGPVQCLERCAPTSILRSS